MRKAAVLALVASWLVFVQGVSAWAAWDPTQQQREKAAVEETISQFRQADSSMKVFFDEAYGYVVFPGIGKGGFIIGGGHGTGWVYEQGTHIGRATVTQVTVGAQIGGQT
ncbi:MAG: hypothetical protein LJE89_04490, partial [Deltaproteobacteria bacterium]|nr:hypothetical protein [Deltaproteobacteria bacterium]